MHPNVPEEPLTAASQLILRALGGGGDRVLTHLAALTWSKGLSLAFKISWKRSNADSEIRPGRISSFLKVKLFLATQIRKTISLVPTELLIILQRKFLTFGVALIPPHFFPKA